ncbi:LCP family protein [Nocardioides donggukensis]|uniref:LCP family protein n=1 Tax=Nocardioides donggukensis TaxID=2774019 RepID=A0A927K2M1_9ACTN|nr:LCP family protein [Nocardioides donggukensis]MBD8868717.1 LCP family protein [Nocardioides donggukensis]
MPPAHDRAAKIRFRRAVTLMVMTLVLPGSAQLVAGRRETGRLALRIWAGLLAVGLASLLVAWVWSGFVFAVMSAPLLLGLLQWALVALALGWAYLFVDAWRLGEPLTLVRRRRLVVVGINGLLCFTVAGTLLFASHLVGTGRGALAAVFGDTVVAGASDGRFNVLLLGGDSGAGRWGLRPDSMTVASIDAETGRTVLVGLPRNLQGFRFAEGSVMDEQFPDGFDCDGCYLNGVSTWAIDNRELFGRSRNPGVDATIEAVEGVTGLDVSYWAMVNLAGFKNLVDAVGGLELTVRDRIPVGLPHEDYFHYIQPGTRVLNGHDTLWFARAREGSDDYSRMARQKCVMNAFVEQVSPQTVLTNFRGLADAAGSTLSTNLPRKEVGRFLDLALKAKGQRISSVSLVPPAINTADPDLDLIREKVQEAIDRAEGTGTAATPKRKPKRPAGTQTGGSLGTRDGGYAANDSDDLAAAC